MTRVIHTGDTHLGYRQYHTPERRDDFLVAFRAVIDDAIEEDVDAVVHAGDLFHDRQPNLTDLLGTVSVLRELRSADIPFLAIVGNHERKRDRQWVDLFETFDLATRLDSDGTTIGNTTFYGLDHVPRSRRDELEYQFSPASEEHAALVSHGLFQPFAHANWDTETVLTESNLSFDAMLLGDNHIPGKAKIVGTWVTYCGSTERTSAEERDPRGYNIVEFDDDVTITRRGLDTRDFVFVDLELGQSEGLERVRSRIREEDVTDAVVIVTLDGDGGTITPASVEEFALDQGALVARVNDHREIQTDDEELDVHFDDPDDAVRTRVRELGLSTAARDIDETVRASTVADSNVRDAVEERVSDLVEGDLGAFESGSGEQTDPDESTNSEPTDDADNADDIETAEPISDATHAEPSDDTVTAESSEDSSDEPSDTTEERPVASDSQVSMEDYL